MATVQRTSRTVLAQPLGLAPSFGFGDRLGLATPGHLAALRSAGHGIRGIFAQQSIRELTRTSRTPEEVMQAAIDALTVSRYTDPWSADADHLKTSEDVVRMATAGFIFFTLDPSEAVDQHADSYDAEALAAKFAAIRDEVPWVETYRGKKIELKSGTIEFSPEALSRAAVKYGRAIQRGITLARRVALEAKRLEQPFEIELSVDETSQPTSYVEHYIVADQFRKADIKLISVAPRFEGDFEKGVDYKGDRALLERTLKVHAEIAERLGPYKLSLHSGSDKLSLYPLLARITDGKFHVKTSGTSYLEALRVVARRAPRLFRQVVELSRDCYDRDKATYHVSATLVGVPAPNQIGSDQELERLYLDTWRDVPAGAGFTAPGRQILHCSFGSVLTDTQLANEIRDVLITHPGDHEEVLKDHFARHLQALQA